MTNTRGPISARPKGESGELKKFTWKAADPNWHNEIKGLYNSFKKSTNFELFEETDMYFLRMICGELSDLKFDPEKNASHYKTQMSMLLEFAPTIASRRRLAMEAEKVVEEKNTAAILAKLAGDILTGKKAGA